MARSGLFDHRKFKRLARALDSETQALGCLEFMWHTAYESGEEYLGDAVDVEAAAHWDGEPKKLCKALLTAGGDGHAGFIEEVAEQPGHYRVHDLFDHSPEYVQKRMMRELARKQRGVTISDLRRDAARKSHEARPRAAASGEQTADGCSKTPANVEQMAANGGHLQTVASATMQTAANVEQTAANGDTPAPAPAPAPAHESQKQKQHPCSDSAKSAEPERASEGIIEPHQKPEVKIDTRSSKTNGEGALALVPPETGKRVSSRPQRVQPDDVGQIYKLYPRKVGKLDALKAITNAIHRVREDKNSGLAGAVAFLKGRTGAYAASPAGRQGKLTPHPATWFNRGSYDDDEREWHRSDAERAASGKRTGDLHRQITDAEYAADYDGGPDERTRLPRV